jgi:hypothetical protein
MQVKLFAMTCGWISGDLTNFLTGEEGRIRLPVPGGVRAKLLERVDRAS